VTKRGEVRRTTPSGLEAEQALRTRRTAWAWGEERLRASGVQPEDAALEADVLLRHAAGLSREEVLTRPGAPLSPIEAARYAELIDRRAAGCPTSYLTGHREFFGVDICVDRRVLIPRPETECLVDVVADILRDHPAPHIVEIGTGSGAVAIALACALPRARVVATDCSAAAVDLARQNAVRAGVGGRIEWATGADLEPLAARGLERAVDAVVANPPYIPTAEIAHLPREVREYEPRVALDGGPDGLAEHRRIIAGAGRYLRAGGVLALEVASLWNQAETVAALIAAGGEFSPRIVRDYAGAQRVVVAVRADD
jgi:release factor glutamine methyltransferase